MYKKIMNKIKLAITHGDANGIGYEIIIKAFLDSRMVEFCTPIIYGNKGALDFWIAKVGEVNNAKFHYTEIASASEAVAGKVNLINVGERYSPKPGEIDPVAGSLAVGALKAAVRDAKAETIDAMVTCPIDKRNTSGDEFGFIGHTEFLAKEFGDNQPLMFMVSDILKVGLVTMHIPLSRVAGAINSENVLQHLRLIKRSLERDFMVRAPKIAVLGLNPHSGDGGLIGHEEMTEIKPALESAKYEDILAFGPFAADGFFGSGSFTKFDAVLAMYHDQGLAPFKALVFDDGVNFTAGLSFVRTSPAHGVGFDIAGKNVANCEPLRAAVYRAIDIFKNRQIDTEITANPLKRVELQNDRDERH